LTIGAADKIRSMIIVAGHLTVAPHQRASFLTDALATISAARNTQGCIDFQLSADPIDPQRINIFEHWETLEAVEAFRGTGPSDDQQTVITGAEVYQHTIAASARL
jgi:quinol monooxygenase YgiN